MYNNYQTDHIERNEKEKSMLVKENCIYRHHFTITFSAYSICIHSYIQRHKRTCITTTQVCKNINGYLKTCSMIEVYFCRQTKHD